MRQDDDDYTIESSAQRACDRREPRTTASPRPAARARERRAPRCLARADLPLATRPSTTTARALPPHLVRGRAHEARPPPRGLGAPLLVGRAARLEQRVAPDLERALLEVLRIGVLVLRRRWERAEHVDGRAGRDRDARRCGALDAEEARLRRAPARAAALALRRHVVGGQHARLVDAALFCAVLELDVERVERLKHLRRKQRKQRARAGAVCETHQREVRCGWRCVDTGGSTPADATRAWQARSALNPPQTTRRSTRRAWLWPVTRTAEI